MKKILAAVPLLFVLVTPAVADPMSPVDYIKTAGASDLYEIESSRMVLETSHDAKVKAFATEMLADHAKSTNAVKGAAAESKIKAPPPALSPPQAQMIAELKAEKGTARDAAYITQQKAAHGQALAVQKAYAAEGSDSALKAAAAGIVPVVEHHIEMLKTM